MVQLRRLRALLPAVVLLLAAACSANPRPATTVERLLDDADAARLAERATVDTVIERLARRAAARGDSTLDVLILSGGGQHGAYRASTS